MQLPVRPRKGFLQKVAANWAEDEKNKKFRKIEMYSFQNNWIRRFL